MIRPIQTRDGFRTASVGWVLVDAGDPSEGWDEIVDFDDQDPTLYPTKEACQQAIDQRRTA